jgi:hypothetical protein
MKKKTQAKTQQQLLKEIAFMKGGGAVIAKELATKELTCSQQSVSAWINGEWLPGGPMQKRIEKLYDIPVPWEIPAELAKPKPPRKRRKKEIA